jgi:hypothetical protein
MPDPAAVAAARQHLTDAGLHPNLLPPTVASFDLDAKTGKFTVTLDAPWPLDVGGWKVQFAKTLRGKLSAGLIDGLEGVTVKLGFMSPGIATIRASADRTELIFGAYGMEQKVGWSEFDA